MFFFSFLALWISQYHDRNVIGNVSVLCRWPFPIQIEKFCSPYQDLVLLIWLVRSFTLWECMMLFKFAFSMFRAWKKRQRHHQILSLMMINQIYFRDYGNREGRIWQLPTWSRAAWNRSHYCPESLENCLIILYL